jgi:hypothetical protein
MKRRCFLALSLAAVVWVIVANNLPAARIAAADWARPLKIEKGRLTAYYPRAWRASVVENAIVISSPGITVWLADYGPRDPDQWPARPRRFELKDADRQFQTCGFDFEGWNLTFAHKGQVVQAVVRVEPGAARSDATSVLDRLSVAG